MDKISTLLGRVPAKTARFSHGEQASVAAGILGCMATRVSPGDILGLRLRSQLIEASGRRSVTDAVQDLLAIQAQDFAQALWAVGLRAPGSTRSDVLGALESGEVVRSLPMRGTLHFVPAQDLGWMLGLTAERSIAAAKTRFRALGLDEATLERSVEVAIKALSGGQRLGRNEFMKVLESRGISTEGQRGYHIIFSLSQRRVVCWGPPSGTQQALVLLDEWVPNPRSLGRDEALREFAVRYFVGHGAATLRDFAWWTKLTLTDARAGIALASDELTELTLDDVSYWAATSQLDAGVASKPGTRVHALPGFDEYLLGYQDRSLPLAAEHSDRIVPGSNGIFLPTIVARGRVVGTWRRTPRSKDAAIEPEYFADASAATSAAFVKSARAYAAFTLN
jgi:hypothetical protein